jgi:dipeptidyl aminopeptidase/acylaminoacyl peptidase
MDSKMDLIGRWTAPMLALLLAIGGTSAGYASPATPGAEVFGTLPVQTDLAMTPDGNWLAWIDHAEAKPRVIMFDVRSRKTHRIMAVPEKTKLRQLVWNDNQTLLIVLSETSESKHDTDTSTEYYRVIAEDVDGGEGRMLPMNDGGSYGRFKKKPPLADLVAIRTLKPQVILMAIRCDVGSCLVEVNTRSGDAKVINVGNRFTIRWVADPEGRPVAREDWDSMHHSYHLLALTSGGVKELFRSDDSTPPKLVGLVPDGSALVLLTTNGHVRQGAWAFPLTGSSPTLLVEDADAEVVSAFRDEHGVVQSVFMSGMKMRIHWLDTAAQRRYELLQRTFPGKEVFLAGTTFDSTKLLAKVETRSNPPVYYLVDLNAHRADIAGEDYPGLANVQLGESRELTYKARDGSEIPAYLTLPIGMGKTAVPLVVFPHGGPGARDLPRFDWLAQFLAARGYAVLQPQFRGSAGFGESFLKAGYRQWGGLMQDDVTDGVKAMIEQGIADAHHVCIVGASSYGGYAALAGAAFTPQLYSCAVSINGVSDLAVLMREEVPMYNEAISASQSSWKMRIGDLSDYSGLKGKSPINSVGSVTAPILIVYGTGDGVVPTEQSERMAQALKGAGKSVELVKLPGEDHWLSRTDTRTEVLRQIERFLKDHI